MHANLKRGTEELVLGKKEQNKELLRNSVEKGTLLWTRNSSVKKGTKEGTNEGTKKELTQDSPWERRQQWMKSSFASSQCSKRTIAAQQQQHITPAGTSAILWLLPHCPRPNKVAIGVQINNQRCRPVHSTATSLEGHLPHWVLLRQWKPFVFSHYKTNAYSPPNPTSRFTRGAFCCITVTSQHNNQVRIEMN
jgi:hypothetical protein